MINAIQQLGLGVLNKEVALNWFARVLGFRTVVFNDQNEAKFMKRYTGEQICQRDAALLFNSHGGSGLEIWQHISRKPLVQPLNMSLQSIGFLICKLRCKKIEQVVASLKQNQEPSLKLIGEITVRPTGEYCCYFSVFGSWFQLVEDKRKFFYEDSSSFCAGVYGVTVGVNSIEHSLKFYRNVLGYDHVVQDKEDEWQDFLGFYKLNKANEERFRRVVLQREEPESGLYANFFGVGEIELIEAVNNPLQMMWEGLSLKDSKDRHLYKDRYWGDPGFIHLCFDVTDMSGLRGFFQDFGLDFTVDTNDEFLMDKTASGRFAYLEDPDGSLIEFVETYRMPLIRKFGISLNVRGRRKTIPSWLLKLAVRDNY